MGLVFFCTWIIGGLGGGCKITWNVFQISSTLLTPFTTFYVRNLYLTPPPPLPLLSVVRNKQGVFATINIHLQAIFFIMLKKCLLQ